MDLILQASLIEETLVIAHDVWVLKRFHDSDLDFDFIDSLWLLQFHDSDGVL